MKLKLILTGVEEAQYFYTWVYVEEHLYNVFKYRYSISLSTWVQVQKYVLVDMLKYQKQK